MPLNKKKVYSTIVDGLNDKISPLLLKDEEAAELLNYEENERGILEKYKGFIKDGSPFDDNSDSFIRFLMNFKRGTSVDVLLMAAYDSGNASPTLKVDLKKTTGDGTYTTVSAGLWHKDFIPRGVVFNNFAIMTNGSEDVQKYDNTTLSTIASAPKGRYIENYKSRVFIAGTASGPSTIYWSATNDETVWDAQAQETVYSQDNGSIIAIKTFADSLIVLKNNGKIYQVVGAFAATEDDSIGGPDFIRPVDVPENMGIISERTPVVHNNYLYFMAETGLYRMDNRLFVEKVSWNIDNFMNSLNFSLGPTTSKTFSFDTQSQWNTGTNTGTRVTTDGTLKNYFDVTSISSAKQLAGLCSVAIDSSNNVHVAYVDSSDNTLLKYVKWLALDNSVVTETAADESTGSIVALSLDISSGGNIGIGYRVNTAGTTHVTKFVERTTSWQTVETAHSAHANVPGSTGFTMRYSTTNPRIAESFDNGVGDTAILYLRRTAGVWEAPIGATSAGTWSHLSMEFDASHPRISAYLPDTSELILRKSDSSGDSGTWTTLDTLTGQQLNDRDCLQLAVNSSTQYVSCFSNNANQTRKRNHNTAATTTLNTDNGSRSRGYQIFSDPDVSTDLDYFYLNYTVSTGVTREKLYFESSTNIENPVANVLNSNLRSGDRAMHHNGRVFATVAFGQNANELIIRRESFRGVWESADTTDSTLTAWSTYQVDNQVINGSSITHQLKTAATAPALALASYATIMPGQVIPGGSDTFIKNKIIFIVTSFSSPSEVGAAIDNYTGAGVDSKQAVGISFKNELFYAVSAVTDTANSKTLILDRAEAFLKTTYPVSAFERFKNKLYAGRSTNGDLLILKQGYNAGGVAYSSDFQSREDLLEAIELDKDINKFYILFEAKSAGTFTFSYRIDNFKTPGGSTWIDQVIDQTSNSNTPGVAEVLVGQKGRSIQWRIQNTGLDQQVGLIAVVLVYDYLNRR